MVTRTPAKPKLIPRFAGVRDRSSCVVLVALCGTGTACLVCFKCPCFFLVKLKLNVLSIATTTAQTRYLTNPFNSSVDDIV